MIATLISPAFHRRRISHIPLACLVFLALVLDAWTLPLVAAENSSSAENIFWSRARKNFQSARVPYFSEPTNDVAALKFGEAAFDWAEFAPDKKQREEIARQGIDACRDVIAQQPKSVGGHYYLAMNLGQLARTKSLGALRIVTEMESEFLLARDLEEKFDFAGPDRNLGLLYLEAPGWPTSIGNRGKARQHLERAAALSPNYPENRLNLLNAYLKWGDKSGANQEYIALKKMWSAAKKEFSGERWEMSWDDWEKRWRKMQGRIGADGMLESPRQKK